MGIKINLNCSYFLRDTKYNIFQLYDILIVIITSKNTQKNIKTLYSLENNDFKALSTHFVN